MPFADIASPNLNCWPIPKPESSRKALCLNLHSQIMMDFHFAGMKSESLCLQGIGKDDLDEAEESAYWRRRYTLRPGLAGGSHDVPSFLAPLKFLVLETGSPLPGIQPHFKHKIMHPLVLGRRHACKYCNAY